MITFQDYERATDKTAWLQGALVSYRNSKEYKKALDEQEYMAGRNTAIQQTVRVIYNMAGLPEPDFTASNMCYHFSQFAYCGYRILVRDIICLATLSFQEDI